jgi:hypothetical protein
MFAWLRRARALATVYREAIGRMAGLAEQWRAGEKMDESELLQLGRAMAQHPELDKVLRSAQRRVEHPEGREAINSILARAVSLVEQRGAPQG